MWVFGGPGAGKTMLSKWLITLLNKQFEAHSEIASGTSVAYFFIKENAENLWKPNMVFKTMAWQIQQTDPVFRYHAATMCKFDRIIARAEDTWEKLFLDFYQSPASQGRRLILVIDGLDEAEISAQRRLLRLVKQYVIGTRAGLPSRIQFAIFGRSTLRLELERVQMDREEKIIEVSSIKYHEDMKNYITDRLKKLTIVQMMQSRKPDGPKEARRFARGIRKKVLDGAGDVFLWAQLLLDQMEGEDDRQIQKVLANPPSHLYDMIFSVFERLSRDPEIDVDVVNRLLGWVACARRPLSFGELDVFLRSGSTAINWFLWNHLRGKFAPILQLRFPKGWDPDAVNLDRAEDQSNAAVESGPGPGQDFQNEQSNGDDDFDLDDVQTVLDCFKALRGGLHNPEFAENYVSYPGFHVFSHLAGIKESTLSEETKTHIVRELYGLMRDESGARTLFSVIGSRENDECERWFSSAAKLGGCSNKQAAWMQEAARPVKIFLEPVAKSAAKRWLAKTGYNDERYLDKSEFQFSNWIFARDGGFYPLSATEIEGLAKWAGPEKTTHWYTGVGWILYEACEYERAVELLSKDSTAWVAMEAMSKCFGDYKDFENAVFWMEKALDTICSPFKDTGIDVFHCDDKYGISHLVKFFLEHEFLPDIGLACRAKGQPECILEALPQALRAIEKAEDISKLIGKLLIFGDFCYNYYDRDDEALSWWEEALSRIGQADPAIQRAYVDEKVIYTNKTAQLYFDMAVYNLQAQIRPTDSVAKLKQLASVTAFIPGSSEDVFAFYTPGYPSLLYGRWLREYEHAEPAVWRKCFRARILEQMNGLDDGDPTNDTAACQKLAMSLFQAADRKRVGAIIAVLYKTLKEYMAEKQRQREAENVPDSQVTSGIE
ncbi:hypothetical protein B0T10DRAFT_565559 [Thelonectria olida]|uniref:Nephrocystin 3-like N-terminal domain-containing protein n=1 Tax=Thelonectria olida TaxID=1576542 RepID=A0A9P8VZC0_9HYPO|nr:hypothetical protein B0T10DRAFT_565559 [Thelonectria olida]